LLGGDHGGRGGAAGAMVVGVAAFKQGRLIGDVVVTVKIPPWYGDGLGRRAYGRDAGRTGGPPGARRARVWHEQRGGACLADSKMPWCARILGRCPDAEAARRAGAWRSG
jgi:hypothetical protein